MALVPFFQYVWGEIIENYEVGQMSINHNKLRRPAPQYAYLSSFRWIGSINEKIVTVQHSHLENLRFSSMWASRGAPRLGRPSKTQKFHLVSELPIRNFEFSRGAKQLQKISNFSGKCL